MARKNKTPLPVIDWVSKGLDLTTTIADIIKTAQPTEQERLIRAEINKVAKMARAQLKADKLRLRKVNQRIKQTRRGLTIARKEGLNTDKLMANLQVLVDMLSETN
jgi:hypothetical protein